VVGWPASFGTTVRASRAFIPGLALFANIVVDNTVKRNFLSPVSFVCPLCAK